jgi:hypothetical protein
MDAGNHFEDRQRCDRRKRMMEKFDRGRPFPRALDRDLLAETRNSGEASFFKNPQSSRPPAIGG